MQQNDLGQLLHDRRLELGLPIRVLHERTGLSSGYLAGIEQGRFRQPNAVNLARIAAALELDSGDVLYAAGYTPAIEPGLTTYLRRRYDLSVEEAEEVRRFVYGLQRPRHTTNQGDQEDESNRATPTA